MEGHQIVPREEKEITLDWQIDGDHETGGTPGVGKPWKREHTFSLVQECHYAYKTTFPSSLKAMPGLASLVVSLGGYDLTAASQT